MSDSNRKDLSPEDIEKVVVERFAENDDIVEYIEDDRLAALKARYAAVEEDENIRDNGFKLVPKSGLLKKNRPSGYGYYYNPHDVSQKIDIAPGTSLLSEQFDSEKSEYDNTTVSFKDIDLNSPSPVAEKEINDKSSEIENSTVTESENSPKNPDAAKTSNNDFSIDDEPPKKKRGRPKKIVIEEVKPLTDETSTTFNTDSSASIKTIMDNPIDKLEQADTIIQAEEPPKKKRGRPRKVVLDISSEASEPLKSIKLKKATASNTTEQTAINQPAPEPPSVEENKEPESSPSTVFNTNTRVVFSDDSTSDGIKRNTDQEINYVFSLNKKKHRGFSHKRKGY